MRYVKRNLVADRSATTLGRGRRVRIREIGAPGAALLNRVVGAVWLISVGLLHSTVIASPGVPTSGEIDAGGINSIMLRAIQPGRHRVAKHDQERGSRIGGMVTLTIRSS